MKKTSFDTKLDYVIDNVSFSQFSINEGDSFHRRIEKHKYALMFVESGEMVFTSWKNRESICITKGTTLFLPKDILYTLSYSKDNTVVKSLRFDMIFDKPIEKFDSPFYKTDDDFVGIHKTISGQRTNSPVFLAAKIYELLYMMDTESVIVPTKFKKILPALNEIQEFYYENKKISYYSNMCYMSEPNFRKVFKEYTGKSPIEYRNMIRLSEAHKMITGHEYSVQEAAYLTGFNNMSFFYELYNKYYK